jgi:hypothetical protein
MATRLRHFKEALFGLIGMRPCALCLRPAAYTCLFSDPEDGPVDRDYFCRRHARSYRFVFCGVPMLPLRDEGA